jgi:formylglycine-generating enzyme required for sulfatase activity
MHGNVWEWTSDSFDAGYGRPRTRPEKVRRGGSWQNHGRLCRSAARDWAMPTSRSLNVGFRVVLDVRSEWQPVQKAPRKRKRPADLM